MKATLLQRNTMKSITSLCVVLTAAAVLDFLPVSAQVVAPAWVLPSINGTDINSTNFAGQVVVLNFWATWCGPCIRELPDLIALQQKYAPDGMTVVGVSIDNSPDGTNPPTTLVSFCAASYGIDYPVVMDRPSGSQMESLYGGITAIPTTFIIDRQNHIAQTWVGAQSYATYESAILPLVAAIPTLHLSVANGQAKISWLATQVAFVVQSTGNLSSGVWTQETAPILSDGTNQFIKVPVGPSQRFFRLERQ